MLGQGDVDALILDLCFNIGDEDNFSKAVAGHFTEKPVRGYLKQTRKDDQFTSLEPHRIEPSSQHNFLKPIVVLTNRTVSAVEVMALMMEQLPTATIMDEPGNGWTVTFSNRSYFSSDMKN